jgi:hypothetical protein
MGAIQINVDLPSHQLLETIRQLSPREKLRINEAIWEMDTDIPLGQQTFVLDRVKSARQNHGRLLDCDEVSKTSISARPRNNN